MATENMKLKVLLDDIRETYRELHDANDTIDSDETFEELMIDLTAHLIFISQGPDDPQETDYRGGAQPIEELLAICFGIMTIYGLDPDLHEVLKARAR